MEKKIAYICKGCRKRCSFVDEKDCEQAEKYCKSCVEVNLNIYIYGKNNKVSFGVDDTIHAHKDTKNHTREVRKIGSLSYECYSENNEKAIQETKAFMLDYLMDELDGLKKTAEREKAKIIKELEGCK